MAPCKKAPASFRGRRNNSVATLLVAETETGNIVLTTFEILLVRKGQPDFNNRTTLFSDDFLRRRICLTANKRHRHESHNRQADNFVEISCD